MAAKNSGAVKWTKEAIEHIRTVHFALIAVSTGLVLLVLSAKPYEARIKITEIVALKRTWSPESLLQHVNDDDPSSGWEERKGLTHQLVEVAPHLVADEEVVPSSTIIVEVHNSKSSKLGDGTQFEVTLPKGFARTPQSAEMDTGA